MLIFLRPHVSPPKSGIGPSAPHFFHAGASMDHAALSRCMERLQMARPVFLQVLLAQSEAGLWNYGSLHDFTAPLLQIEGGKRWISSLQRIARRMNEVFLDFYKVPVSTSLEKQIGRGSFTSDVYLRYGSKVATYCLRAVVSQGAYRR